MDRIHLNNLQKDIKEACEGIPGLPGKLEMSRDTRSAFFTAAYVIRGTTVAYVMININDNYEKAKSNVLNFNRKVKSYKKD